MSLPQARSSPIHPDDHLELLRQETSYGGLRSSLDWVTYLLLAGDMAYAVVYPSYLRGPTTIGAVVLCWIAAALAFPLIVVARNMAYVLIDIADTLLAAHAREQTAPGPR